MGYKAIITDGKRFRNVCEKFRNYNYAFVCHTEYSLVNADVIQRAIDSEAIATIGEIAMAIGILVGRSSMTDAVEIDVYVSDNEVSDYVTAINVGMYNVSIRVHKMIVRKKKEECKLDSEPIDPSNKEVSSVCMDSVKDASLEVLGEDVDFPVLVSYTTGEENNIPANSLDSVVPTEQKNWKARIKTNKYSNEQIILLEKASEYNFGEKIGRSFRYSNEGLAFMYKLIEEEQFPISTVSIVTGIKASNLYLVHKNFKLMSTEQQESLKSNSNNSLLYNSADDRITSVYKNLRGHSLTGNCIKDIENIVHLSFDIKDKKILEDAFVYSSSYEDFLDKINNSEFSYKNEMSEIKDVYCCLKDIVSFTN